MLIMYQPTIGKPAFTIIFFSSERYDQYKDPKKYKFVYAPERGGLIARDKRRPKMMCCHPWRDNYTRYACSIPVVLEYQTSARIITNQSAKRDTFTNSSHFYPSVSTVLCYQYESFSYECY